MLEISGFLAALMKKLSRQKKSRSSKKVNVIVLVLLVISLPIIILASTQHQQIKQEAAGNLASNTTSVSPPASFVTPSGTPQTLTCGDCMKTNPNSSLCLSSEGKQSFCQDNATGNPSTSDNVCVNCVPPTPTPTATPTPIPFTINYNGPVKGQVFKASITDDTFKATPQTPPLFSESFSDIAFNSFSPEVYCSNYKQKNSSSRPMLNTDPQTDGSCNFTAVQGNGYQAGAGNLQAFDMELTGTFYVSTTGYATFKVNHDDGWYIGIGQSDGVSPTYTSGDRSNTPTNTPFNSYPVVGGYNNDKIGTPNTVTVYFPAAGNYPFELDYFEVHDATLYLILSANNQLITQNPTSTLTPPPGCYYSNNTTCPSGFGCLGGTTNGQEMLVCPSGTPTPDGTVAIASQKQSSNIIQQVVNTMQKFFSH
jgi:hypothetical protein